MTATESQGSLVCHRGFGASPFFWEIKQTSASSETECSVSRCNTPLPSPASTSRPGPCDGAIARAPAAPAAPSTWTRWAARPAACLRNFPALWRNRKTLKLPSGCAEKRQRGIMGEQTATHRCRWRGWRSSSPFPGHWWRSSDTGRTSERTRFQSGRSLTVPLRDRGRRETLVMS